MTVDEILQEISNLDEREANRLEEAWAKQVKQEKGLLKALHMKIHLADGTCTNAYKVTTLYELPEDAPLTFLNHALQRNDISKIRKIEITFDY